MKPKLLQNWNLGNYGQMQNGEVVGSDPIWRVEENRYHNINLSLIRYLE